MNIRQSITGASAVLVLISGVFVVDARYPKAEELTQVEQRLQAQIDKKADKSFIKRLLEIAHKQKIRELKRDQYQIKRKPDLDEGDRYLLQDIQTDIEEAEATLEAEY
jgi:hypothetical protein